MKSCHIATAALCLCASFDGFAEESNHPVGDHLISKVYRVSPYFNEMMVERYYERHLEKKPPPNNQGLPVRAVYPSEYLRDEGIDVSSEKGAAVMFIPHSQTLVFTHTPENHTKLRKLMAELKKLEVKGGRERRKEN